jgi:hypothetical protein
MNWTLQPISFPKPYLPLLFVQNPLRFSPFVFNGFRTLSFSVSSKSLACHSYENCRVSPNNSHFGTEHPRSMRVLLALSAEGSESAAANESKALSDIQTLPLPAHPAPVIPSGAGRLSLSHSLLRRGRPAQSRNLLSPWLTGATPLSATLVDPPVSAENKGLTRSLTSLDATLTKATTY